MNQKSEFLYHVRKQIVLYINKRNVFSKFVLIYENMFSWENFLLNWWKQSQRLSLLSLLFRKSFFYYNCVSSLIYPVLNKKKINMRIQLFSLICPFPPVFSCVIIFDSIDIDKCCMFFGKYLIVLWQTPA